MLSPKDSSNTNEPRKGEKVYAHKNRALRVYKASLNHYRFSIAIQIYLTLNI